MLVVENFLLIALDPKLGTATLPRPHPSADRLAAAGLLVDLADARHLVANRGALQANAEFPVTHPLLQLALAALGPSQRPAAEAIAVVARRLHSLPARVAEGLFRRDVLHRVRKRHWLIFPRTTYPLRSVQARNEAIEALRTAARATGRDARGLALLLLFDIGGALPRYLEARDHDAAAGRLIALNATDPRADNATRVLAAVRSALLDA